MAGERFHMVQNVSMAVHHIGREPTVRGQGRWGWGDGEGEVVLCSQGPEVPAHVCSTWSLYLPPSLYPHPPNFHSPGFILPSSARFSTPRSSPARLLEP